MRISPFLRGFSGFLFLPQDIPGRVQNSDDIYLVVLDVVSVLWTFMPEGHTSF